MFRALRVALAAAVASVALAGGVVVTTSAPASAACAKPSAELPKLVNRADVVFVGRIDKVSGESQNWTYEITAKTVYKGAIEYKLQVLSQGECELGQLPEGTEYLFFATGPASPYTADLHSGTGPVREARLAKVEALTGQATTIQAPPPPKPSYTPVNTEEPPGFARTAAPGAAAAIVGILGLLLVRRLARR